MSRVHNNHSITECRFHTSIMHYGLLSIEHWSSGYGNPQITKPLVAMQALCMRRQSPGKLNPG